MFTKQHYEFVANVLRQSRPIDMFDSALKSDWERLVGVFSGSFAADSPHFNPELFRRACGL